MELTIAANKENNTAHNMELTITANKGECTGATAITPYKAKYEAKKPRYISKVEKKDAYAMTSKSTKFSFRTKRRETTSKAPQAIPKIPQSLTVTFTDEDMQEEDSDYNRPSYVSGYLCEVKINKILVDGGSAMNILPLHILKLLNISTEDLQPTCVMIQGFNQGGQRELGKVSLHLVIGELETISWSHVIDSKSTYNVLLGRPWIHSSDVVPSTLHQYLKYYKDGSKRTIKAYENPFTIKESHFVDAKYYQRKKTSEAQPKEEPDACKAARPTHPDTSEKVTEALKGLTLPLTQAKEVASTSLKGFVTQVQGSKIEHGMLNPKAYDLLVKAGFDPAKDVGMGKLPPEVIEGKVHGLSEIQKMLQCKGYIIKSSTAGFWYALKQPLHSLISNIQVLRKRVANYYIVDAGQEHRRNPRAAKTIRSQKKTKADGQPHSKDINPKFYQINLKPRQGGKPNRSTLGDRSLKNEGTTQGGGPTLIRGQKSRVLPTQPQTKTGWETKRIDSRRLLAQE
ncbi:hypothetical protein LIER_16157 [Lithospermum erythrorhizon]|uniref:Uncharacterized protein n=1 Tax=Lithospermum erythrorhizon TaxID=34254 RepID=A0AAV3Q8S6_LITER